MSLTTCYCRVQTETHCLLRALIPMPEDDGRLVFAKLIALSLFGVWATVYLALTLERVEAVEPPHFWLLTAVVFLIIGKLWDLEAIKRVVTGRDS